MKAPVLPPETPRPDVDLDATAELPVLDAAEVELEGESDDSADAAHAATDTWILPPGSGLAPIHPPGPAAPRHPEDGAPLAHSGAPAGGREIRDLEQKLKTTLAKLRDAEQLIAQQAEQLRELEADARVRAIAEQRAASLGDELIRAREKSSALSEQVTQLQQRLAHRELVTSGDFARERERQQSLTADAQAHSARLIEDLHLERARSASCLESLQTLESRRQIAESMTIELQRETEKWRNTEVELRERLGSRDSRVRELEIELDRRAAQIGDLEQHLSSFEARVAEQGTGEAQRQEELQRLRTQRAELDVMLAAERERKTELEAALAAERQRIPELEQRTAARPLQTDSEARPARVTELAGELRTDAAQSRPAYDGLHPEPTADGVARLLIHSDDGREVVHVLGRKTSIGRTPDNDVQIEGQHISRHHAVILAGPATTLIEDLNSTNGVMVNGKRIMRQVLQDGDQVTIGRTLYRFAVRRAGEPR